jgi:hypothetical protein
VYTYVYICNALLNFYSWGRSIFVCVCVCVLLRFELWVSHLLGRHSTTWGILPPLFCVRYFWNRVSQTICPWLALKWDPPELCLLSSWDHRYEPPVLSIGTASWWPEGWRMLVICVICHLLLDLCHQSNCTALSSLEGFWVMDIAFDNGSKVYYFRVDFLKGSAILVIFLLFFLNCRNLC